MNWIKKLIKIAAAQSKINKLGIVNPALKFFVHKYENSAGIDWNKIKSPEDIEAHIYSKLLPYLYKKIDPNSDDNNYLKPEHLDLADEIAQHPDDPQMQQAARIYQANPEAAIQHILEGLNQGKKEGFQQWWNYLTQEGDLYRSNPAFMYSILKPIIDSSPENAKNGPPPLNAEALAEIYEEITEQGVTNINILKKYRQISSKLDKKGIESVKTGEEGEWIKIPGKTSDPENYKENLDKLMRFAQGSGWCIAQPGYASNYLSTGDFWYYLVDGRPMVAIRMIGSNKVAEIRGHNNQIEQLEPYWQEVTSFLHQSPFEYKDVPQYRHIEEIYLMNANLERGSKDYNTVLQKIKDDHKTYLRLSDENRKRFPEFLEAAKDGYRRELNDYLSEIEAPGLEEGQYLRSFERFQEHYRSIPEEIRIALGDMNDRILQAHKKAYHNNPIIFPEFSPEMQNQFSKEDQINAWSNYIDQDPYHYNDKRIPLDIRPYFPVEVLKNKWKEMLKKNSDHIDYMPPEILELFQPGEIEEQILQDFASFPVSVVHGRLNKLDRMEKLIAQGRIEKQQVMDILAKSILQNPKWMNRLPENYKTELLQMRNVQTAVDQGAKKHVVRDTGYFKSLPPDAQNAVLQQYGAEIGQAFAKDQNKYRGLLHEFWVNTPASVRPYLPPNVIENVAQYYANALKGSLQTFEAMKTKIPEDIQPRIIPKLSHNRNWYKKAYLSKVASVSFWIEGSDKITQPMNKSDICNDLSRFIYYHFDTNNELGLTYQDFDPYMSEGDISDPIGPISIYLRNPEIKKETILSIIEQYNNYKELVHLKFLGINQSGMDPSLNVARILVDKNETTNLEKLPSMNISNGNAEALMTLLNNEGMPGLDIYGGEIDTNQLKTVLSNIEQNEFLIDSYTKEPSTTFDSNKLDIDFDKANIIDFGRSYAQIKRYIDGLKTMIAYIDNNNLPIKTINYG